MVERTASWANSAPAGLVGSWNWDIQRNLVYCGALFADYFSLEPEAVLHGVSYERVVEAVHPHDLDDLSAAVRLAIRNGSEFSHIYRVNTKSFGERTVLASGQAFRDSHGKPTCFPGYLIDVTGRNVRADALQAVRAHLAFSKRQARHLGDPALMYLIDALLEELGTRREN